MNLREIAEKDLELTLEDDIHGFGVPATITDPSGTIGVLKVQAGDVHLLFDPDTDIPINNRRIHISIRISSLTKAGLDIPQAQPDESVNPWVFEFADVNRIIRKCTVTESRPNRTLGIVTIILELIVD
jgi:hypothetical protein